MNEYQRLVNEIYEKKIKKYRLKPDALSDKMHDQLYGEAIREAQMELATFGGGKGA